ncbi:bifunctional riboflavin kinase/FAD synthetase [Synechococcus sp. Nb3U1]|uniref:bifunctional riboflavin kinase/FAD synthetase n=1 Tax=Synechococcus sp. Nb3U1 TaxID=1914529 RepID=UPI001F0172C3|nr:bifunctional riboflavin kinase/FAD synthetase [Synechococcus sp. Nb3U1]MCF2971040.1 bifunctional riboflavin kinase/FAD synthetase [Synechococcus sp. Nb3U1]
MHITSDLAQTLRPTAVAIGNFDGLHLGHQKVLRPIQESGQGVRTVLTFHPHPQEVLTGRSQLLLTPPTEKLALLAQMGFEQVILFPFTAAFARQHPQEFIQDILEQGLRARHLSVGWDFCFAHRRSGSAQTLQAWGSEHCIPVEVIPEAQFHGERVSSSRIRAALATGEVSTAADLLGRPYRLIGEVVQGDQRGRQLGFPTANLRLPPEKFLPRDGVYSVWVYLPGADQALPGVMNVGYRPTFAGLQHTIEVHLLDWAGDLYGQELQVVLEGFIRTERRFPGVAELIEQIQQDCQTARIQLGLAEQVRML